MTNKIYFALICSILFASSCKKPGTPNIPVDSAMRQAFSFKLGSYWIYLDSISGKTDSFYVGAFWTDILTQYNGQKYEHMGTLIYCCDTNGTVNDTTTWELDLVTNRICLTNIFGLGSNLGNVIINYFPLINFPFSRSITISNITDYSGYNGKTSIQLFNSFSIGIKNYSNIAVINNSASSFVPVLPSHDSTIWFSYNNTFYLCPDIGFIKIVINEPFESNYRNWQLLRYKIIN